MPFNFFEIAVDALAFAASAVEVAALLVRNGDAEPKSFGEPGSMNAIAVAQLNFEEGHYQRAAIPVLSAALHGWLEASDYFLPYTDLHALRAAAFDRADEPDSALVHYARAVDAWQHADPRFAPRVAAMRTRVRAIRMRRNPHG